MVGRIPHSGQLRDFRQQGLFHAILQGDIDHAAAMATATEKQHGNVVGGDRLQRHAAAAQTPPLPYKLATVDA